MSLPVVVNAKRQILGKHWQRMLTKYGAVLSQKERRILTAYYGLSGKNPTTLRELAAEHSVSTEQIRRIRLTAERKLKKARAEPVADERKAIGGHEFIYESIPYDAFAGAHIRTDKSWCPIRIPTIAVRVGCYPPPPPETTLSQYRHAMRSLLDSVRNL